MTQIQYTKTHKGSRDNLQTHITYQGIEAPILPKFKSWKVFICKMQYTCYLNAAIS